MDSTSAATAKPHGELPLLDPGRTLDSVTREIGDIPLSSKAPATWWIGLALSFSLLMLLMASIGMLLIRGIGIWGLNVPIAWGFAIVNFVWWIGIGHAGTLISAVLFLLHQEWRTSINRFAEATTLFAVACAGLFPLLHLGRVARFYYILPYPNTMDLWPQWRSPLVWDVFAVFTYGTVSFLFWYMGLVPDLATLRDRSRNRFAQLFYGAAALGWRNSARHWRRYQMAYLLFAGLATPLVVSVHSIVSLDFASSLLPGWHTTIFPPYFVAGAIYSGFAMLLTLLVPIRKIYKLEDLITNRHLEYMGKVLLVAGLVVAYGYLMEAFVAFYSGHEYERFMMMNRAEGPYRYSYWALWICNIIVPQAIWISAVRKSPLALFTISLFVNVGMWLERYIIVVTSLHRDFLPSSWDMYSGTIWDWSLFVGTIGLFLFLLFLFIRWLPMIAIAENKEMLAEYRKHEASEA